jgi:hypothetical protein
VAFFGMRFCSCQSRLIRLSGKAYSWTAASPMPDPRRSSQAPAFTNRGAIMRATRRPRGDALSISAIMRARREIRASSNSRNLVLT